MNTHLEILVKELIKNGVSAKCCEIITDNEGNVSASEPFLDFSEHDKMVAEEKDKKIAELTEELWKINEDFKKTASENTALQAENDQLYERISDFEFGDNSRIEELEKENAELDHMRKSWMETAQKWSELNSELQDKIDKLECFCKTISELEDRHQSDCIRINQLLTTIDVLTERYQKLREVHWV